jgi:hypothetical protein
VVNFSSCEYKRLIHDDHFATIGSYAQGYTVVLWTINKQEEFLDVYKKSDQPNAPFRTFHCTPTETTVPNTAATKNALAQFKWAAPANITPPNEPTAAPADPIPIRVDNGHGVRSTRARAGTATMVDTKETDSHHA